MSRAVTVPSDIVMSQVWSPTLASVIRPAIAVSVPVDAPSLLATVIQEGHVVPSPNVTSVASSSVAVRVMLRAASSTTLPASTAPSPSPERYGASLTAVSVITKVSEAVVPAPSDVVQVIAYVLSLPLSANTRSAWRPVPPRVAEPPESAVSESHAGMSPPVSTQVIVIESPSTSDEAVVSTSNATSS